MKVSERNELGITRYQWFVTSADSHLDDATAAAVAEGS